jgi:hypothetical protein
MSINIDASGCHRSVGGDVALFDETSGVELPDDVARRERQTERWKVVMILELVHALRSYCPEQLTNAGEFHIIMEKHLC